MHSPQRTFKVLGYPRKRQIEHRSSADQHIIMSGAQSSCGREPHDFPKTTANPISLDGISDLF